MRKPLAPCCLFLLQAGIDGPSILATEPQSALIGSTFVSVRSFSPTLLPLRQSSSPKDRCKSSQSAISISHPESERSDSFTMLAT